ncbi:hypothetical protein M0R45_006426 [Rubus argutus]|uniref:Uncharacterized protein n=1 Tax=Rubus argutus TaxID=59490 RepID=A0AAW1YQZ3_RUBAR
MLCRCRSSSTYNHRAQLAIQAQPKLCCDTHLRHHCSESSSKPRHHILASSLCSGHSLPPLQSHQHHQSSLTHAAVPLLHHHLRTTFLGHLLPTPLNQLSLLSINQTQMRVRD